MSINIDYLEIMGSALTDRTGVKIQSGNEWRANVKTKTLEYNQEDLRKLDFDIAKGLLLHELAHIKFTTNPKETPTAKKYPHATHDIINAIEDIRIEKKLTHQLGYFAEFPLMSLAGVAIENNLKKSAGDFTQISKLNQFLHLLLMKKETERSDNVCDLIGYQAQLIINSSYPIIKFDPEVINVFLDHDIEIRKIVESTTKAKDTNELAEIVEDRLIPLIKDFLQEDEMDSGKSGKNGEPDKTKEMLEMARKAINMISAGRHKTKCSVPELAQTLFEYGSISRILGQKINDILKERRATKYTGNNNSGKLLSKNVFKILNNENRIFSRKLENKPDLYRFYFCIDSSGSMQGKSAYYAIQAGQIINKALEIFGLPIKIYQYDSEAEELDNIEDYDSTGGGTYDQSALKLVLEDLLKYPEDEKIIFMLTDGCTYTDNERLRTLIKIKKNKGYILGIGIGDFELYGLEENYENVIKVKNPKDLPLELVRIMRNIISR